MPPDLPLFPSRDQMRDYILAFAAHHGLGAHIRFNTAVISARPLDSEGLSGWEVLTSDGEGAVIAMTKVAALEHAQDRIRVNAICPGPVRTPMSEEEGDASVDITPIRRRAEPEEISAAVAFLASDDAVYVTGAELAVDGGYLAR